MGARQHSWHSKHTVYILKWLWWNYEKVGILNVRTKKCMITTTHSTILHVEPHDSFVGHQGNCHIVSHRLFTVCSVTETALSIWYWIELPICYSKCQIQTNHEISYIEFYMSRKQYKEKMVSPGVLWIPNLTDPIGSRICAHWLWIF